MARRFIRLNKILVPTLTALVVIAQTGQALAMTDYEISETLATYPNIAVEYDRANSDRSMHLAAPLGGAAINEYNPFDDDRFESVNVKTLSNVSAAKFNSIKDFTDYESDIKGKWSESYITTLVNKGGIKGYEDGTFRPKANITTAELVSILLGTSGAEVDTTNWPESVMAQANKAGILDSGMLTEGNVPISREKMAYVLVNSASKLLGEQVTSDKYAPDSVIPDLASARSEYRDEIKAAYGLGLLAGNDDAGTFKPSAPTTREETCVIINRLFKYTDRVDNLHKPTPKPEVTPPVPGDVPHWSIEDFEFGNTEAEKYNDPNVYIGDRTGAIYPREGEIGPNGKPITRDPVTGVLGFGNGQKGGIYLNRTYIHKASGKDVPFELKVGSLTPGDRIRGMDGQYQKRGNYVYWEQEWSWIEGAARDNLDATRGKVPHGAYADIHGNVYKGNDIDGEAFYKYDAYANSNEDGKGGWVYIRRLG